MLHARIEELSEDINDSFKQLADYQIQTERKIGARFDKIETNMATKEDLAAISEDMTDSFKQLADYQIQTERKIYARFDKIETNMATKEDLTAIKGDIAVVKGELSGVKEDIAAMEGRVLDAFKQLLVMIDSRLPPSQG